jgi:hypothetical protein
VSDDRFWGLIEGHVEIGEAFDADVSKLVDALTSLPPYCA